jgi:hypothetical protein
MIPGTVLLLGPSAWATFPTRSNPLASTSWT